MAEVKREIYSRTVRLVGEEGLKRLFATRVILFGVGGVGSWCAESLVRTGVLHLTIVDSDRVDPSNINRQLPATTCTVGRLKVEVLRERLLEINPDAQVIAISKPYTEETAREFSLESYDYVVDAIDSLREKAQLILHATRTRPHFLSSMGAALKMDPTRIAVAEFWKVHGCPLGAALRNKFKRMGQFPARKFKCVYSDELLPNLGESPKFSDLKKGVNQAKETGNTREKVQSMWEAKKAQVNGSLVHITAGFGFTLAGLIVQDILRKKA